MTGWGRLGGLLAAVGLAAAVTGCGQLFTEGRQPVTLTQLSSRVDSLDAQVGELQAALAGSGGGAAAGSTAGTSAGTVAPGLASAVVEADVLNVRDDPSLAGTIKGTLLQNAVVGILKEDGNWTEITYTNAKTQVTLTGWVDSDYLGPVSPPASAAGGSAASSGASAAGAAAAAGQSGGAQAAASSTNAAQPAATSVTSGTAASGLGSGPAAGDALGGAY